MFYSSRLRRLYINEESPGYCFIAVFSLLCVIIAGCSGERATQAVDRDLDLSRAESSEIDAGDRELIIKAKYSYIRSYPGGGGVFIVRLVADSYYNNNVSLYLAADPALNARLDRKTLSPGSKIAEITVRLDESIAPGDYEIELKAVGSGSRSGIPRYQVIYLRVEVFQWGPAYPTNVIPKMDEFVSWLESEHPELGNFSSRAWFPYMTYPQIWIVEHWTFLDDDWEFRLCYHVTIPPYDWSKILLRRRGKWDPVLAAMRESDGTIHQIPISEYPTKFGY